MSTTWGCSGGSPPRGLRQGAPKGKRVVVVYDTAAICHQFWKRCRQECAVYFISRVKERMVFEWLHSEPVDPSDPRNAGVVEDRRVLTREGHRMRVIEYVDPVGGGRYEFLTNEPDLPAGVVVELYRRRWEAEKAFDGVKNKLGERKAWGSTLVAKASQAWFIAMGHNLLLMHEARLEREKGVVNGAEDRRREQRSGEAREKCRKEGSVMSSLLLEARGATQTSLKFIRWLRHCLRDHAAEAAAVPRLMALYANL